MKGTKLWGGVFDKETDELAWRFGQSIETDVVLLKEEIEVSLAHAKMLGTTGIISSEDAETLVKGLLDVGQELTDNQSSLPIDAEDLHGAIESFLLHKVGETAKRLHAGRSRNDQIVTVTKLWLKRKSLSMVQMLEAAQRALLDLAKEHRSDLMPGYTHQQPAQPITLGYLLLAYFWMLERDKTRFKAIVEECDTCPLGSAALAGTTLPIDRQLTSSLLGFQGPTANALDSVSDRDFVCDALHACAMLMQHLSRVSQEIVLFCTSEVGFMKLDESCSTGSSVMPQKRNPDFAELIRGRSGRALGNWTTVMATMKALPLGYNRDQQEDKPPLFDSISLCQDSLALVVTMLRTAQFDTGRMATQSTAGFSTATAVAESLVQQGVPFRTAHEIVGKWVKECLAEGKTLDAIQPENETEAIALKVSDPNQAVEGRASSGATSHQAIEDQLLAAQKALDLSVSTHS